MGWYLRKSVGLGPPRFNLSKSGIGASIGVKGLRVSKGPRGKQINAGAGGLYYRGSLDAPANSPHAEASNVSELATLDESNATQAGATETSRGSRASLGKQLLNGLIFGVISGISSSLFRGGR